MSITFYKQQICKIKGSITDTDELCANITIIHQYVTTSPAKTRLRSFSNCLCFKQPNQATNMAICDSKLVLVPVRPRFMLLMSLV